jgi:hypothetical protein
MCSRYGGNEKAELPPKFVPNIETVLQRDAVLSAARRRGLADTRARAGLRAPVDNARLREC